MVDLPCFNPRICKRCDQLAYKRSSGVKVSIHASVKDATKASALAARAIMVSIHASVKDATLCRVVVIFLDRVSIHASVKDATELRVDADRNSLWVSIHASVKDATQQ